jgi:hypothetical protein
LTIIVLDSPPRVTYGNRSSQEASMSAKLEYLAYAIGIVVGIIFVFQEYRQKAPASDAIDKYQRLKNFIVVVGGRTGKFGYNELVPGEHRLVEPQSGSRHAANVFLHQHKGAADDLLDVLNS